MLLLQDVQFEIDTKTRDTAFFISKNDNNTLDISMDISFQENIFEEESVSPCLVINEHKTNVKTLEQIFGNSFSVEDIQTADDREDTFYLYEHEPFMQYKLEILTVEKEKIHIKCVGTVITDGYANPYKTANFTLDCWLPIITNKNDWEKYGL